MVGKTKPWACVTCPKSHCSRVEAVQNSGLLSPGPQPRGEQASWLTQGSLVPCRNHGDSDEQTARPQCPGERLRQRGEKGQAPGGMGWAGLHLTGSPLQLLEALAQLREDRQVRVLLFRSAVKGVFCAGADLKEREQMSEAEVEVFVQRLRGMMTEIAPSTRLGTQNKKGEQKAAFPAPTIAALDGFALGGGLELALACDLRVAGGTQRLPRCLGVALAKELIFTGRRLSGTQAQVLGLVNHAVAQNEEGNAAYHRARALAQEILPQAPIAVRLSKVAIDRGMEVDIASGMAIEGICYAQNIPTQDRLEGMAAFREKRPPKFVGK
uniref:Enoyl-CoA hydratase domain containing 2 n=1 Tax=Equus asinus asinus TaxID=83772 RepID=A0A8C4M710_EQUAS